MYAYIRGKLEAKLADSVIVEAAGVGYKIFTSSNTLASLPAAGIAVGGGRRDGGGDGGGSDGGDGSGNSGSRSVSTGSAGSSGSVKLYTRFIVKEDSHTLYGFLTQEELGVFDILLTVSKVGPKIALGILSAASPSQFGLAVITEDYKALTRAQGVGRKLAQTIVFELKDKLSKEQGAFSELKSAIGGGSADIAERGKFAEAVSALMILGYGSADANRMTSAAYADELGLEDIIRNALVGAGKL
jgi:Holliday junction DNA helicase RuvA